jgi:alpha,alpha-trehalase
MATAPNAGLRHSGSNSDLDPYSADHIYYSEERADQNVKSTRARTYSTGEDRRSTFKNVLDRTHARQPRRRGSHDEVAIAPRKFLIDVDSTLESLLATEDTDGNMQITIEDAGPKVSPTTLNLWETC